MEDNTMKLEKQFAVACSSKLYDDVERLAERRDCSKSAVIRTAVKRYLKTLEKRTRKQSVHA